MGFPSWTGRRQLSDIAILGLQLQVRRAWQRERAAERAQQVTQASSRCANCAMVLPCSASWVIWIHFGIGPIPLFVCLCYIVMRDFGMESRCWRHSMPRGWCILKDNSVKCSKVHAFGLKSRAQAAIIHLFQSTSCVIFGCLIHSPKLFIVIWCYPLGFKFILVVFQPEIQECAGCHGLWWHADTEFGHRRGFPRCGQCGNPARHPPPVLPVSQLGFQTGSDPNGPGTACVFFVFFSVSEYARKSKAFRDDRW
jgi:hypothetical protein